MEDWESALEEVSDEEMEEIEKVLKKIAENVRDLDFVELEIEEYGNRLARRKSKRPK